MPCKSSKQRLTLTERLSEFAVKRQWICPELAALPRGKRLLILRDWQRRWPVDSDTVLGMGLSLGTFVLMIFALGRFLAMYRDHGGMPLSDVLMFTVPWLVAMCSLVWLIRMALRRGWSRYVADRWINGRPRFCLSCQYDLRATAGDHCPECGEEIMKIG